MKILMLGWQLLPKECFFKKNLHSQSDFKWPIKAGQKPHPLPTSS